MSTTNSTGHPSEVRRVEFYSATRDADVKADVEVESDGRASVQQAWEYDGGRGRWARWLPVRLTEDEARRAMELATEE